MSTQPGTLGMRHTKSTAKIKFFFVHSLFLFIFIIIITITIIDESDFTEGMGLLRVYFPTNKKEDRKAPENCASFVFSLCGSILSPFYVCRKNGDPSLPDYKASWMFGLVRKCAD